SIDSDKSSLLNSLLGGLLGTGINLEVGGWQGLASADIDLVKFLDLAKVKFSAATTGELLKTDVTLVDMVDIMIDALKTEDATAKAALGTLGSQIPLLTQKVTLGEIIQLETNYGAIATADINLLSLLTTSIGVFNNKSGITADVGLDLPPADVNLKLKLIEAPVIVLANEGTTLHSAAARLFLDAQVETQVGEQVVILRVPIYIELGSGSATVTNIEAANKGSATMDASVSAARSFLGDITEDFFDSTNKDFTEADFGQATILNQPPLKVKAKSYMDAQGAKGVLTFTPLNKAPLKESVKGEAGTTVSSLLTSLINNTELDAGAGIDAAEIRDTLNNTLAPALQGLDPLVEILGVSPGKADVTVHSAVYTARMAK
ncbi:MAG: hypothetical protein HY786_08545, partial [Deltaproteobacteria bacterium]|nr:hypothetical protein [Deltaproteobacteria bacterium]